MNFFFRQCQKGSHNSVLLKTLWLVFLYHFPNNYYDPSNYNIPSLLCLYYRHVL